MKKWFFVPLLVLAGCGLFEADSEEPLEELLPPKNELIPLAVGNYWVYEQWYLDPTWLDTVRNEVLNVQNIIVENTKVHAYGAYRFRYDTRPRDDALISLAANGPEGYYSLGSRTPTDSLYKLSQGLYYKYPASIGDTWEYTNSHYNAETGKFSLGSTRTIEFIDTAKIVETPAGTFENCYVYSHWDWSDTSMFIHYIYVKPMVGIVGIDTYDIEDEFVGQQRLLEYELKSSP